MFSSFEGVIRRTLAESQIRAQFTIRMMKIPNKTSAFVRSPKIRLAKECSCVGMSKSGSSGYHLMVFEVEIYFRCRRKSQDVRSREIDSIAYLPIHEPRWNENRLLHQVDALHKPLDDIDDALVGELLVIVDDATQTVPAKGRQKSVGRSMNGL